VHVVPHQVPLAGHGPRWQVVSADIPIIALSAHALEEERARCLAAGMTAYVPKPIDPDQLVAAVAERMAPGQP